ncbi:MAG: hypothetical protein M0R40_06595 [Firmicutes bacterium]|nr:hypothetical protein [Bacillota bacterium]
MLHIRHCQRCNTIYKYGSDKMCSVCLKEIDELMVKIRSYLEDNPRSGIFEIAKDLNANEKDIFYLLREERLSINPKISSGKYSLICLRCGGVIETGKYCDTCIRQIQHELKTATSAFADVKEKQNEHTSAISRQSVPETAKVKMHTAYRHKKMS